MAIFNPDVPNVKPEEYLKSSSPISQKTAVGDTSAGTLLKGFGDLIEGGVKVADLGIKDYLATNVRHDVEAERAEYSAAATAGYDAYLTGSVPPPPVTKANAKDAYDAPSQSLLPEDQKIPGDLSQGLPRAVTTLQNAKEARKIPEIYYDSQLMAIAKKYRNQFPGYAEYIDHQVSGITGRDPANNYIKSVMSLLATAQAGSQDETKRTLALMDKHIDLPLMDKMRERYLAGATDPETGRPVDGNSIRSFINKFEVQKWKTEQGNREVKNSENNRDLLKINATRRAQDLSLEVADKYFYTMEAAGGKTLAQLVDDPAVRADPKQLADLAPVFQQMKIAYLKELNAEFNKKIEGSDLSISRGVGTEINKITTEGAAIFDNISKAYQEGDSAKAAFLANGVKSRTNQATLKLFEHPNTQPLMDLMSGVEKFGPEFQGIWWREILSQFSGLKGNIKQYVGEQLTKAVVQPEKQTTGETFTLIEAVKEAKTKGLPTGQVFKHYFDLIDGPTGFTNPKTPLAAKQEIATFLFDPKNLNLLREFEAGSNGERSLFQRLTRQDVTDTVNSLKDPVLSSNYKDFATHSFTNVLFRKDIQDLGTVQAIPGTKLIWNTDNKTPFWELVDTGKVTGAQSFNRAPQIDYFNQLLRRLNGGIARIAPILEQEGENVQGYLLGTFQRNGLDLENAQGIPADLLKSLVTEGKERIKERKKREERYQP